MCSAICILLFSTLFGNSTWLRTQWPYWGCNHAAWTLRIDGFITGEHSIFEQAGLNVCFRLPTYCEARRHHKAQHGEYPGIPRQASYSCVVQGKVYKTATSLRKHGQVTAAFVSAWPNCRNWIWPSLVSLAVSCRVPTSSASILRTPRFASTASDWVMELMPLKARSAIGPSKALAPWPSEAILPSNTNHLQSSLSIVLVTRVIFGWNALCFGHWYMLIPAKQRGRQVLWRDKCSFTAHARWRRWHTRWKPFLQLPPGQ